MCLIPSMSLQLQSDSPIVKYVCFTKKQKQFLYSFCPFKQTDYCQFIIKYITTMLTNFIISYILLNFYSQKAFETLP